MTLYNNQSQVGTFVFTQLQHLKEGTDARQLAERLGLTLYRGDLVRCFVSPESHAHGDRTPSCRVYSDGFHCFGCGAGGDVVDIIRAVRSCSFVAACRLLQELAGQHGVPARLRRERAVRKRPSAPAKPPLSDEVQRLWQVSRPVGEVGTVATWLEEDRSLDVVRVEDGDLARALSHHSPRPSWAYRGELLLVPTFDPDGRLVSVRFRRPRPGERPKELAPRGHRAVGVMSCPLGRLLLGRSVLGDGITPAADLVAEVGVVIAEGSPDFLTWATNWSFAQEDAPAVLGIYQGAWQQTFAQRLPFGARVAIATDDNAAGSRYAAHILQTLNGRPDLRLFRWRGTDHA